jgi:hypothetical protein
MNNTLIIVCIVAIIGIIAIVAMTWGATTSTPKNKIDTPIVSVDNENAAAGESSSNDTLEEPSIETSTWATADEYIEWFIETKPITPMDLQQLPDSSEHNFTADEINNAINNYHIIWDEEAKEVAAILYQTGNFNSYSLLHNQLTAVGFTEDQAGKALLELGYFD